MFSLANDTVQVLGPFAKDTLKQYVYEMGRLEMKRIITCEYKTKRPLS